MVDNIHEKINETMLIATFMMGDASFGIGAQQVQEVVRVGDITPVHHAPSYVVGIRNLRGKIVTVIDLSVRLELGSINGLPDNRILIVDSQGEPVGLVVDSVADTISANDKDIMPPPPNLHGIQSKHMKGVLRSGERLVALLDLGVILQLEEQANRTLNSDEKTK